MELSLYTTLLWNQFGAAIDTLENAIKACPEDLWGDRSKHHEYWYVTYHTIFWLDYYLSESPEGFTPPAPFTLGEFDPSGILPDRVYSKDEMLNYLSHCREKCRKKILAMTDDSLQARWKKGQMDFSIAELQLYNLRHVQHHAAQLHLILRQTIDFAPNWVSRTKHPLS